MKPLTIAATVVALALASACVQAHANGKPYPPAPQPSPAPSSSSSTSGAQSTAAAKAGANAGAQAFSGGAGDSNFYVFPAPGGAAPLPANLCPQGDSEAWGIGWNFYWHSTSRTRTEMECLDKMLAVIRAAQVPPAPPQRVQIVDHENAPPAACAKARKVAAPARTKLHGCRS